MAGSPQNYGPSFETFLQATAIARAAGTAGSEPLSKGQPAAQEYVLTPPRRSPQKDLGEHLEQLVQAMSAWTA